MKTLMKAIAAREGFNVEGSRAQRNANPGNISYGAFAKAHGATRVEADGHSYKGRFAVFPNEETGFACLRALLLSPTYKNLTIADAIQRYAPGVENDTESYLSYVCAQCGCKPTDIVWQVMTRAAA